LLKIVPGFDERGNVIKTEGEKLAGGTLPTAMTVITGMPGDDLLAYYCCSKEPTVLRIPFIRDISGFLPSNSGQRPISEILRRRPGSTVCTPHISFLDPPTPSAKNLLKDKIKLANIKTQVVVGF
jgi:hypothetical protein